MATSSNEEVRKWMRSLQEAIKASGGVVDQVTSNSVVVVVVVIYVSDIVVVE